MEYSTSPMENQMEAGKKKIVKKEEDNDRYSTVANAGDQKKPSEKAKRSIDSMFRRSVKVENAKCEQPTKNANQITVRPHATISPISNKVKNSGSTDRHQPAISTTTFAATGTNELSIWESEREDLDVACSEDDGDINETGLPKQCQVDSNSNNANGCDGGQFHCLDCEAVFEMKAAFNVHIASHDGYKRYKCTVCEKRFTRSDILKIHTRVHTGERPFKCPTCKKRFSYLGNLNKHKVVHTGKRPFKCNVCKKGFTQNENLKRHKRIHTGEKPFDCDVCEKKFTTKWELIVHTRYHTGERPHKCELCNKGFIHTGHLLSHKRTHSGEKPYKCLTCGKCFSRSSGLQRHKRTHTEPVDDPQLDVSQDGMDQSSTTAACDPLNNYANGQKIRYKTKSIDFVVKKMTRRNPDVVYLVWSKKFTMEVAAAVALSGFNCILCVKKIQPQPFLDVVKLSDGLHTCHVEVGPDSKTLRLFSFGGMILPEKITNHGRFKSLAKFESKMRRFSQSEGKDIINIFKHSKKNSGWYISLRDGLKGESIITDYV